MAKHYTVGYHESNREHKDICTYANDCYEAKEIALHDVKHLQEHPHSIDSIFMEEWMTLLM
mgnify:CR=1 FL=1